ncbi:hypothetical protein IMSAGC003_02647 [Lachnospiraceae bacterium]|jgi:putative membrane protein|nr:DUF368 domain-containing protein [Acetatifactor sp.]GFH96093.1 hypothetical protein IMSAGC003_02647 [Lachnospiraceae bacterium]
MEKKGKWWHVLARAMAVGGTMTVPGASGGTMAMILGIYEELIESMGSLPGLLAECIRCGNDGCARRRLWDCLRFLALFSLGALAGMALLAKGVLSLLERYPMAVSYFFLGAVAGGIPLICRQAQVKKITWQALFWPLAGLLMVYGLAALPEGLFTAGLPGAASSPGVPSFRALLFQFLGGCILAVALILPGISVSQMLLMLGLYEPVMEAVSSLRFASLLPLGLGAVLCTLLVTRLLGSAMQRRPQPTYLLILGFVLGSLGELYPGLPEGWNLLFAPLAAVAGYQLLSRLSRRAE